MSNEAQLAALTAENRLLLEEIRVSRQAAEITAQLVVQQFEKSESMLVRVGEAKTIAEAALREAEAAEIRLRDSYAELEEANQRLQKLDQMKSDFLSSVSHELRTPLTSIRGFASLVDREFSRSFAPLAGADAILEKKSHRIRDNLGIILKESERLTRLINDVLDLAKIEAGRVDWHDTRIQPASLIEDAANAVHGMFDQKPAVALRLDIQPDLPSCIGDVDKLLQVLANLLNNAIKFTAQGVVTIKAFLNPDNLLQIEIHDTGIGFPPEEAEAIFDKFQQAKHGDTLVDRPKGTGLGLAISREIVCRHGGRVWAQSQPGTGSLFALTLPVATDTQLAELTSTAVPPEPTFCVAEASPDTGEPTSDDAVKRKILVVDDDPGVRDYLTQLLGESGYHVIAAADGLAALIAAKTHHPDLITMDIAMPVMDGYTAITNLRANPELQHIPIMVISAMPGWDNAGGDMAMAKPLEEPRFLENIHLLLDRERRSSVVSHCLILHEGHEAPAMIPEMFNNQCQPEFCAIDNLAERLRSGFHGMVVIPAHLVGHVELHQLQATVSLEVIIMPPPVAGNPG